MMAYIEGGRGMRFKIDGPEFAEGRQELICEIGPDGGQAVSLSKNGFLHV